MTPVLYFHGFASSPSSAKITMLRPLLEPDGIVLDTPDLNVPSFAELDWEAMVGLALERAHAVRPRALVGSSLGALVALETARRGIEVPLVLIAPAIGIGARWTTRPPDGPRAFFEQMNAVDADADPPSSRVVVLMGRRDESVPFSLVEETWKRWESIGLAPGSRLIVFDDGDHGLTAHVDEIAREIVTAAR